MESHHIECPNSYIDAIIYNCHIQATKSHLHKCYYSQFSQIGPIPTNFIQKGIE